MNAGEPTTFTVENVFTIAGRGTVIAGFLDGPAPLVVGTVLTSLAPVSEVHVADVRSMGMKRTGKPKRDLPHLSVLLADPYPGVARGMVFFLP
jgi:translation elongation factor EF-Tu-like GTPase